MPTGADRAAADGGELLVGRRARARAAPTPRSTTTGARSTAAASPIARRPARAATRFLEFWNLVFMAYEQHAGRHADAPSEREHRHGAGARAWRGDHPGRHVGLRDRRVPADHGVDRRRVGRRLRRLARRDEGAPHPRRPRPWHDVSRGRRRHAVEREARATFCGASSGGRSQQARRIGLEDIWRLPAVVVEQMGDAYPELRAQAAAIEQVVGLRRSGSRRRSTRPREVRRAGRRVGNLGRGRVYPRGDLRLSRRAHSRARRRARPGRWTSTATATHGGAPRDLAREERPRVEYARSRGARRRFRRLREDRGADGDRRARAREDGRFRAKLHESPFYAEGGGQVSDTGSIEHDWRQARAPSSSSAVRAGDDQTLLLEGEGFAVGDRVRAVVPWSHPLPDDGKSHGDSSPAQGPPGSARRPRAAGGIGRPPRQAPLRLHAWAGAERRRARRRGAARQREGLREPPRARVRRSRSRRRRSLGATMLFTEKYGEDVRVIEIPGYSMELCGGTHVAKTAEVGPFVDRLGELRRLGSAQDRGGDLGRGVRACCRPFHELDAMRMELDECARRSRGARLPRSRTSSPM